MLPSTGNAARAALSESTGEKPRILSDEKYTKDGNVAKKLDSFDGD